jgi:uroporphyrin-III C-methyltransferase/precorrin-2 dehydrogenase/sirohydrochlorin ferrochelatase
MPVRTLRQLVETAISHGLDPATPAVAVARATRPDQQVIASAISELPQQLAATPLPGPVTVMIGRVFATRSGLLSSRASAARPGTHTPYSLDRSVAIVPG